jgi:hypothetical protein
VGALRPAIRRLHRPKEPLLERVRSALVELLVRLAERRQRGAQLVDRIGDGVQQLLAGFRRHVGHGGEATGR